jgi:hypothetical protein
MSVCRRCSDVFRRKRGCSFVVSLDGNIEVDGRGHRA